MGLSGISTGFESDYLNEIMWLSEQTGQEYRLPSEAKWEYAARAGTTTRYWWGDEPGRNHANCYDCGSQWDDEQTAPVGSFKANPFGLHDTSGNVWEWVQDCYVENFYGPKFFTQKKGGNPVFI